MIDHNGGHDYCNDVDKTCGRLENEGLADLNVA